MEFAEETKILIFIMSVHQQQGFKLKEGRFGFRRFGYKEENFYGDSSETL